jgi:hypothetical protein
MMAVKDKPAYPLTIEVGSEVISVLFQDEKFNASVRKIYLPFASDKEPQYLIKVKVNRRCGISAVSDRLTSSFDAKGTYTIESGEFKGLLDLQKKSGTLSLINGWSREIFVSVLANLCMAILFKKGALVFHASAVVKNGKAYIFSGPSGAGKSTIAQSSCGFRILSEELIGLLPRDDTFRAFALPYIEDRRFGSRAKGSFPVAALFKLAQDRRNYLKAIPKPLALADFFILPHGFQHLCTLADYFSVYHQLISGVSCYELHFTPDRSFWRCIDEYVN